MSNCITRFFERAAKGIKKWNENLHYLPVEESDYIKSGADELLNLLKEKLKERLSEKKATLGDMEAVDKNLKKITELGGAISHLARSIDRCNDLVVVIVEEGRLEYDYVFEIACLTMDSLRDLELHVEQLEDGHKQLIKKMEDLVSKMSHQRKLEFSLCAPVND